MLECLRPHPHRGDVIAAGAVPLALAAIVIELRMTQWSLAPRFAVVALISVLLLTMAWLAPLESETPRTYHSILLVAGLVPLIVALQLLAEILGAHRPPGAGRRCAGRSGSTAGSRQRSGPACELGRLHADRRARGAQSPWRHSSPGCSDRSGDGTFRAILVVLSLGVRRGRRSAARHAASARRRARRCRRGRRRSRWR